MYSIIATVLKPRAVTEEMFHFFDAYLAMDWRMVDASRKWPAGSNFYRGPFVKAYYKYFDSQINTVEEANGFLAKADKSIHRWEGRSIFTGLSEVNRILKNRFDNARAS